jgi:uncharacterized membrane protein required for colicin V production
LLDLLLGLIVLLFVPFGIRRGAAKEVMVSAGILFGALVATTWADRGGAELAARFGVDSRVAPFVVAMAALFAGVFLIGYGGGAALGRIPQGWMSHLVGGLLAIVNGALFLTYLLRFLDAYLQPPRALNDGVVAETLREWFDLFLLAVGGGLILLVILGIVVSTVRHQNEPRPAVVTAPPRQRPVRVASGGDTGKYEPDAAPLAGTEVHQATVDQTAPLLERPRRPWDEPGQTGNGRYESWSADSSPGGSARPQDVGDLWERRSSAASWSAGSGAPAGSQPGFRPSSSSEATGGRCASCGAAVGPRDLFCPSCGKTV